MDGDDGIPDEEAWIANARYNADEEWLHDEWQRIRENDPHMKLFLLDGRENYVQNITNLEWLRLGRDISNNNILTELNLRFLHDGALDDQKMSSLFRGLTKSRSIGEIHLGRNGLSVDGVRSMVPLLQNADNLIHLDLNDNNLRSDGFNVLLMALQNSAVKVLYCNRCGIESIEIDSEQKPKQLMELYLSSNNINVDGCRELAKLLQGRSAILDVLYLKGNKIDDEGVRILVDALQNNTSLESLDLRRNNGISKQGHIMLLKLVNDISSIKATLQSNHKLECLNLYPLGAYEESQAHPFGAYEEIQAHIDEAVGVNEKEGNRNPAAAARTKLIKTQLQSSKRAELAELQGVSQSVYSEINPLHLPEVIALVGKNHGQGELYVALKSSIAGVISTVNRKQCLQQESAYYWAKIEEYSSKIADYRAKMEAAEAEIATIEAGEGHVVDMRSESLLRNKRRRE